MIITKIQNVCFYILYIFIICLTKITQCMVFTVYIFIICLTNITQCMVFTVYIFIICLTKITQCMVFTVYIFIICLTKKNPVYGIYCLYSAPSVYRPPFYHQPRLSPNFSSVPISPIKNTPLYCQTRLPPSATGFQTQKS